MFFRSLLDPRNPALPAGRFSEVNRRRGIGEEGLCPSEALAKEGFAIP